MVISGNRGHAWPLISGWFSCSNRITSLSNRLCFGEGGEGFIKIYSFWCLIYESHAESVGRAARLRRTWLWYKFVRFFSFPPLHFVLFILHLWNYNDNMSVYVLFVVRHALLKALKRDDTIAKSITVYNFGFFFFSFWARFSIPSNRIYYIIVCNCTEKKKQRDDSFFLFVFNPPTHIHTRNDGFSTAATAATASRSSCSIPDMVSEVVFFVFFCFDDLLFSQNSQSFDVNTA